MAQSVKLSDDIMALARRQADLAPGGRGSSLDTFTAKMAGGIVGS